MAELASAPDPPDRAESQRAADGRDGSAFIGIHPIAQDADAQGEQKRPEQRPFGRDPALQHPADGGARQSGGEQDSDPWLVEELLAERQRQPLQRLIFGGVGGLLQFLEGFEMLPEGMRRIGQPAVRVGVAREKIAELVMNDGFRDRQPGKQGNAENQRQQAIEAQAQAWRRARD